MTPLQRVMAVIEGRQPDRVPVCLHNFLMACAEAGVSMEEYRVHPKAMARAHLHAVEKYGYDCILLDADTTMLAEAMGAKSECAPGEPGRIVAPAIDSLDDVGSLRPANPETDGRIPAVLEAIRLIREGLGGKIAIRGNADQCAFGLACLLRGTEDFLMDLKERPDHPGIAHLLEIAYQTHLATHRAVKRAGAHFTSLGDSLSGPDVISPALYRRFARPWQERLVRTLAAEGIFPVIHICGNTSAILTDFADYPYCGFELDYKTDAGKAKTTAGAAHVLFGNVDPSGILALGTPERVREVTRETLRLWMPDGHFILNAGCAIPAETPEANLRAFLDIAREEGRYGGS
ncbi:MAG: uroporphyrinogen decarboxylase family protein [Verrucomicrobiae bacterium]|nr:uroporphyrinogen decarboxylase family protein [Verrucomicrobiae bacterium]